MVPLKDGSTLENSEYTTPELRNKYYKGFDHVRLYGEDIVDKFKAFSTIDIVSTQDLCNEEQIEKYNIWRGHRIFVCKK